MLRNRSTSSRACWREILPKTLLPVDDSVAGNRSMFSMAYSARRCQRIGRGRRIVGWGSVIEKKWQVSIGHCVGWRRLIANRPCLHAPKG